MELDTEDAIGLGCAKMDFGEKDTVLAVIESLLEDQDKKIFEKSQQDFVTILNQYQEQPHLLDQCLPELLQKLLGMFAGPLLLRQRAAKLMYILMKVRSYKRTLKCFPHEVSDLEFVLDLLQQENSEDKENWEVSYVLLLWLSLIILIPFNLERFDDGTQDKLVTRVANFVKIYLQSFSSNQDAAAYVASVFLTRPDVKDKELPPFINWCQQVLQKIEVRPRLGVLRALSSVFKRAKREDIVPYSEPLFRAVITYDLKASSEILLRKMYLKLVQRIGLSLLRPRIASWRYQRGSRSLAVNLTKDTNTVMLANESEQVEEDSEIPEVLEEILDELLNGLRDKDTVVRWSSAKGIGRISNRLPKECVDDIVGSVLEFFSITEADSAWHGGCLALAELGRRGLLLPDRLTEVIPLLLKALTYDELRGSFSVGSHIRDAACYVCWSFARAYDPVILKPFLHDLARGLVINAVFDREINCRRAAAAAFQEHVGRQGAFPHGIDIITTVDYFSVGMKPHAYLELSVVIGGFQEYTTALIDHLLEFKVGHWDLSIRSLTAKSLNRLTPLAPEYILHQVTPTFIKLSTGVELYPRHGSLLSLGETIHALSLVARQKGQTPLDYIGDDLAKQVVDVTVAISEGRFLRGVGSDITKQALCFLIEKICEAELCGKDSKIFDVWQSAVDLCLQDRDRTVQDCAANALHAFAEAIYSTDPQRFDKAVRNYIVNLGGKNQDHRCGHSLALSRLPAKVIKDHMSRVIENLALCTVITPETEKWADSRQYAVRALATVVKKCEDFPSALKRVLEALLDAMNDYTVDSRGDIGAGVREAAMVSIKDALLFAVTKGYSPDSSLVVQVFQAVAKQALEKIDRTRNVAGTVFCKLLHSEPRIPNIPEVGLLLQTFPSEQTAQTNWANPSESFPRFLELIGSETFCKPVVLGLVSSVGGMTESLVHQASHALFQILKKHKKSPVLDSFCNAVVAVYKENSKNDRITLPLLSFLDRLLGSSHLDSVLEDSSKTFSAEILQLTKVEILNSTKPQKIIASVDVFCHLVHADLKVAKRALVQLAILLCHKFPRVRKVAAAKLYETLILYTDRDVVPVESVGEVMNVLSETDWDQDLDVLRKIRNDLCKMMDVQPPVAVTKTNR